MGNTSYKVRKDDWEFDVNLLPADLNLDENVDILDVIRTVDFILSENEPDPFYLFKSDLDKSGTVDVLDILIILDIIL